MSSVEDGTCESDMSRFSLLMLLIATQAFGQTINLECEVQGRDFIISKKSGAEDMQVGPAIVSVAIENNPNYLNIEITGNPPFKTGGLHMKNGVGKNSSGIFDNQLIKVVDKDSSISTSIEINRMTGMIAVYERFDGAEMKSSTNYSGKCRPATTRKF